MIRFLAVDNASEVSYLNRIRLDEVDLVLIKNLLSQTMIRVSLEKLEYCDHRFYGGNDSATVLTAVAFNPLGLSGYDKVRC